MWECKCILLYFSATFIEKFWHPCQRSTDHICEGLFLDCLFYPIDLSMSVFVQYHTVLITIDFIVSFEIRYLRLCPYFLRFFWLLIFINRLLIYHLFLDIDLSILILINIPDINLSINFFPLPVPLVPVS